MKGKITSIIAIFLLVVLLASPVLATTANGLDVNICSAYWDKGTLFTFARIAHEDPVSLDFSLLVDEAKVEQVRPQTIQDANAVIHYVLLIDASNSMPKYRSSISHLAQEILRAKQNIRISVMEFGDSCTPVASNMNDWIEVSTALNSIWYNKDGSNITGSVAQAIEQLGSAGDNDGVVMTNLVVITDGEPWYSNDSEEEQQLEHQSNVYLQRMMAAYPEIVVHSFSFGQWNEQAQEALNDERGIHDTGDNAEAFGEELAEYADSMYCIPFSLPGYDKEAILSANIVLSVGRSFVSCGSVRNVNITPVVEMPPLETDPTDEDPANTTEASTVSTTEATSGNNEESTVPSETIAPGTETDPSVPNSTGSSEEETEVTTDPTASTTSFPDGPYKKDFSVWYIVVPIVSLALLLLVVVIWNSMIPRDTIRMRIVQVSGRKIVLRNVYYLDHELLIGTGRRCHIIIPGATRNTVNVRLFKQNQIIYIEDMGMSEDVLLNGMQIFSSNRLRSDDEITIGAITLKVLF